MQVCGELPLMVCAAAVAYSSKRVWHCSALRGLRGRALSGGKMEYAVLITPGLLPEHRLTPPPATASSMLLYATCLSWDWRSEGLCLHHLEEGEGEEGEGKGGGERRGRGEVWEYRAAGGTLYAMDATPSPCPCLLCR